MAEKVSREGVVSLSDKSIKKPERKEFTKEAVRRIKMETGDVIRISFLSDEVIARMRHYKQGVGYRRCTLYTGFCPACIAADRKSQFNQPNLKFASESFGANVFVYDTVATDDDPVCPIEGLPGDIYLFAFGAEKFAALRQIKGMHKTLVGLDLQITCTDGNFQKMSIMAYPREMSFSNDEAVQARLQAMVKDRGYPLDKMLAKEVSPVQLVKDFDLDPRLLDLPEAGLSKEAMIQDGAQAMPAAPQRDIPMPTADDYRPPANSRPQAANVAPQTGDPANIASTPKTAAAKPEVVTDANDILNNL